MSKAVWGFVLGLLIGCVGAFIGSTIAQGDYNRKIDTISDELDASRKANRKLTESNTLLTEYYAGATAKIGELEQRIIADNKRYTEQITGIRNSLGGIAEGLGTSRGTIREIIDGLEQLKKIIHSL